MIGLGEGIGFERIRRITGYLVGTLDRFNDAKRAEEHDRVKHSIGDTMSIAERGSPLSGTRYSSEGRV